MFSITGGKDDIMGKKIKKKRIFVIALCLFFTVLVSGCTINSSQPENNSILSPELVATETIQQVISENTKPVVSSKAYCPEYDEQTKQELVEKAKDEIVRIFPNVDRSTLEGSWEDRYSKYSNVGINGPPVIVFYNVDDTSEKFFATQKVRWEGLEQNIQNNIVTIKVSPVSGDIVFYGPQSRVPPKKEEIRTVSLEEAEGRAQEFIREVKGNDFVEKNIDEFSLYKVDTDSTIGDGLSVLLYYKMYQDVPCFNDQIYIHYDLIEDRVFRYWDELKEPELMKDLMALSAVPTIPLGKAKKILEEKLKENYPDEELNIQYYKGDDHESLLNWYDLDELVYSDNPETIRLIWYLSFNDDEMREIDARMTTNAIIDAHTGEIISLSFRGLRIS